MGPSELFWRNNKAWGINWKFLWHKSLFKKRIVLQAEIILLQHQQTPVADAPPEL